MTNAIIMRGEVSPIVCEISKAMCELGLYDQVTDVMTQELIDALNEYRVMNALPVLDFADPNTVRLLGIECTGDDVLALARYAEAQCDSEIEMFDCALEVVKLCRKYNLSVQEYTKMPSNTTVSQTAVTTAILALLN